ncbi:MAG: hypothetical protein LBP79_02890, partial [Clostridiales bacterium]|nr:hypothetical protein [Clostridiales bacterium]
ALYKISDVTAKTVKIPSLTTGGRVNTDRDNITAAARKYDKSQCEIRFRRKRRRVLTSLYYGRYKI